MEKRMGRLRNMLMVMAAAIVISICTVGVTAQASEWDEYVPEDAVEYNGHYYKVYTVTKTWDKAEEYCENMGGYLVTITSSDEQAFLMELLEDYPDYKYQIGLSHDIDDCGTWVTGEAVSYTNWGDNEPDASGVGCVISNFVSSGTYNGSQYYIEVGEWDDTDNSSTVKGFICEWSEPFSISSASVKLSRSTYTYDGDSHTPDVTVRINGKTLTEGTDYTVSYSNNKNAGTAAATIKGIGIYTGTVKKTFTIKKKSIASGSAVLSAATYTYSGNTKRPTVKNVKVTLNGSKKTLKKGTDYKVTYASSSKAVGKYKVTITGIGNYSGSITKTYKINPKQASIRMVKSSSSKKLTVKWSKVSGSVTKYQIRYKKKGAGSWSYATVSASKLSCTLTGLKSGKNYYVQVRAGKKVNGTTYYGSWSEKEIVTVK